MGAIRFLAIAVLVYLGYRMLQKLTKTNKQEHAKKSPEYNGVLVEDPVCGKLVPKDQAISHEKQGRIYYFCSEQCCSTFQQQGDKS